MNSQSSQSPITHMGRVHQTNGNPPNRNLCSSRIDYFEKNVANRSEKSVVQQSIERLYGTQALSSGYRLTRPAGKYEKWDSSEQKETQSHISGSSPKSFPSVFKHLRPEFRHQLPVNNGRVDSQPVAHNGIHSNSPVIEKTSFQSVKCKEVEGPIVRHIPIVLEDSKEEQTCVNAASKPPLSDTYVQAHSQTKVQEPHSNLVSPKLVHKIQSIDLVDGTSHGKLDGKKIKSDFKEQQIPPSPKTTKDGQYFLKIVDQEVSYLNREADRIDRDLEDIESYVSEDVKGKLLAATGKIRLLISKKIKQFKGLCDKNLKNDPSEEFPTTNDDLAGFWDMVSIQVEQVKSLIVEINKLRENNWKEETKKTQSQKTLSQKNRSQVSKSRPTKEVSDEQKSKLEERKKATEARRKAMREAMAAKKKQTAHDSGEVTIFMAKDA